MGKGLSMAARREITKKYAREYQRADKTGKSRLLDELTGVTGWSRDHARRAIRAAAARTGPASVVRRKPRPRKYSYDALKVLQVVWLVSGQPSGKYLAAVMDDTLERITRFGEFGRATDRVTDQVLDELRSMSAATIDRYLKPHKASLTPIALSGTRPGRILRSAIPVRTAMDDAVDQPGFFELDTVAHCGHTLAGEFLWTLSATDVLLGWTLLVTVKNKAFVHVAAGLEWIDATSPIPICAMDFDNGSEFMNWGVIDWCDSRGIPVTRSRPYRHNDNAHVEQRNGDWVRKHAFRFRYETDAELALLNELWDLVMKRRNHLLPCVKATGWTETSAGRKKRIYDKPRSPYQRLLDAGILDETARTAIELEHKTLNPAAITRRINQIQRQLIDLAAARTQGTRPAA
jgi:hypothetical protein